MRKERLQRMICEVIRVGFWPVVGLVALIFLGGKHKGEHYNGSAPYYGGETWFRGQGQTKKPGSWSSGRHRQR